MSGRAVTSPLGLRVVHLVIFLAFSAATVAGMLPELQQLRAALGHRWHFGTPPSSLGIAAALCAIACSVVLVAALVAGRSAPLWISGAVLVAFTVSLGQQGFPSSRRSAPGANLAMLEVGKALHQTMVERLQQTGSVPTRTPQWEAALKALTPIEPSPFRTRTFSNVGWQLQTLAREGDFLAEAAPGTFTVFIPDDGSRFTITMIGLDPAHQTFRLRDDQGQPFELKGAFTPTPAR